MLVLLRSWVNQFLCLIGITPSSYRYQFLMNGHHWPLAKNCLTYQRECFYYCFFLGVVLNKVWFCPQGTFHSVWRRFYSCHNCEGGVEYYWHLVGRGEGFHKAYPTMHRTAPKESPGPKCQSCHCWEALFLASLCILFLYYGDTILKSTYAHEQGGRALIITETSFCIIMYHLCLWDFKLDSLSKVETCPWKVPIISSQLCLQRTKNPTA